MQASFFSSTFSDNLSGSSSTRSPDFVKRRLDHYYRAINAIVLSRQNACSGLLPASVAVTTHGDYRDAWVRDNVYSILCVFGLALAYRRLDDDDGRAYELEHSCVKLMRGLLTSMMRQASKVEQFKQTQALEHSLHAKYSTTTGEPVVGDFEWGHLQLDATSIFLLMLAQMTAAGMQIIYTSDEVDFVQNLVFYIERAYRTPDYGIWERGNKINHGQPELNSSSIGMVVAALQAINGINLFGPRGGPSTVIYALPDEITRNTTVLHSALPRESNSKEIDAALLSIISYPAFAVSDKALVERTRNDIIKKLGGKYGCKRFLRDGHQTTVEDTSRLHYEPHELEVFKDIESEWPLFFTYLILDGIFTGNDVQAEEFAEALEPLIISSGQLNQLGLKLEGINVDTQRVPSDATGSTPPITPRAPRDDIPLIPELYFVARDRVDAEKANPHSQPRMPNDNVPLVWANSLYFLSQLLRENLLSPAEVDPLGRRLLPKFNKASNTVVQIVLLSEDVQLQSKLAVYGLETQTVDEVQPVTIGSHKALLEVYSTLGMNRKLGLSGRPRRPVGCLSTSRLYRVQGQLYAFTPHFLDRETFYMTSDNEYLMALFEQELAFIRDNWTCSGRPTLVVMLTHAMMDSITGGRPSTHSANSNQTAMNLSRPSIRYRGRNILNFMMNLRAGQCNGVRVRLGRLSEMVRTSYIESLDFLVNKNDVDWYGILRGSGRFGHSPRDILSASARKSRQHRRSSTRSRSRSRLASPVLKPEKYLKDETKSIGIVGTIVASPPPSATLPSLSLDMSLLSNHHTPIDKEGKEIESKASINTSSSNAAIPEPLSLERTGTDLSEALSDDTVLDIDTLSLTLGDPSSVPQAIEYLIDLLHYLHSCVGSAYQIDALSCTVEQLLEEVYRKALGLRMWHVVRQSAGLLRKVVNSLSINLTDLLIRQKQVTFSSGDEEVFIRSPLPPNALTELLYKHCQDDAREGPLVQELLTYMGSFIRGSPQMFDGIMRLRTHYIIVALREDISRTKGCDEETAVELLMQMSPNDLQRLLATVLSGPSLCSPFKEPSDSPKMDDEKESKKQSNSNHKNIEHLQTQRLVRDLSRSSSSVVAVSVQSAGFDAGDFTHITVNNVEYSMNLRGLNVVVIDRLGEVTEVASFDTHLSSEESDAFSKLVDQLENGSVIVVAIKDESSWHLSLSAIQACRSLGSKSIDQVQFRDSWCFIGTKGNTSLAVESYRPAKDGPTELLTKRIDFSRPPVDQSATSSCNSLSSLAQLSQHYPSPSGGRWLHRRKNDGSLNRVPEGFYPRVWRILSQSAGLLIREERLPRDPIVSEMTPEEFNFAIEVESFLDNLIDPAERQIAVECLMVIFDMSSETEETDMKTPCDPGHSPLLDLSRDIDLVKIIDHAVAQYREQHLSTLPAETAETEQKMAEQKEQPSEDKIGEEQLRLLSYQYFFDLPFDQQNGTATFLRESARQLLLS
ncbi:glycosyl hydrolases family 15-domain-containing protein [Syncephalis fuscata]|nr:glycosyl hydrolases family 15-domain-containing protein [Syncephalis fuscata]